MTLYVHMQIPITHKSDGYLTINTTIMVMTDHHILWSYHKHNYKF